MTVPRITRRDFVAAAMVGAAGSATGLFWTVLPQITLGKASAEPELPTLTPTVCGMCSANCGLLAYLQGTHLYKLEGNFLHSHSEGKICARGSAGIMHLYDPNRLKNPLRRTADGKYEQISWDQALSEIGAKLRQTADKYGRQSLSWVHGSTLSEEWDEQFMRAFGSPNIFSTASLSSNPATVAGQTTLGAVPVPDLSRARYILILGRNFAENIFVSDLNGLLTAKENGARIVVVDSRLTNTAAQAHEWVPIRPGTEGAFLLALSNAIFRETTYDKDFATQKTLGLQEFRDAVEDKTPAWAESRCDVPEATIRRLAQELAAAAPACVIDPGWHDTWGAHYSNSVQTNRLALALTALLGSYGIEGGLILPPPSPLGSFRFPWTPPITMPRADAAGAGAFLPLADKDGPVQRLPELITSGQPYPVRSLIANHFDLAHYLPNRAKVVAALRNLDLLVVIDTVMNETANFAHYVLPASTFLERYDPPVASQRLVVEVALRQPVVQPLYDTRPPYEIISGLAAAAGLGDYFGFTFDDVVKAKLAPIATSLDDLKQKGVWRKPEALRYGDPTFATPSRKVELYLSNFKAAGFDPLPNYEALATEPHGKDQFRLLHGRDVIDVGTATQYNLLLRGLVPQVELWINSARAAQLGIVDGEEVSVSSEAGTLKMAARLTEAIHPEAVCLAPIPWQAKGGDSKGQTSINDSILLVDRVDPIAGSAALDETVVRVQKLGH